MVWCGARNGRTGQERLPGHQRARDAVDLGGLERLLQAHRGKDGGEAAGQHGFSRAGRAEQHDVVAAGSRHLQGALGGGLAPDVGKVGLVRRTCAHERGYVGSGRGNGIFAQQVTAHFEQSAGAADLQSFDHRGLGDIGVRNQDTAESGRTGGESHGKGTAHGAQISLEPDLAQHHVLLEAVFGQLAAGHQNAERDGKIESRAVFTNVGRGKVDRDAAERETKAGVHQRRTDPFPALFYRAMGKADCRERGQSVGNVHLDIHRIGVDAEDRGRTDSGQQRSERVIRKEEPQGSPGPIGARYPAGATVDRFVQHFSAGVGFGTAQTRPAEYPPGPLPRRGAQIRSHT